MIKLLQLILKGVQNVIEVIGGPKTGNWGFDNWEDVFEDQAGDPETWNQLNDTEELDFDRDLVRDRESDYGEAA